MVQRQPTSDILRIYSPELPELKGDLDRWTLANQLYLENCADRLTTLAASGATRLKALDAVTMSLDGLTYRLTLRKGLYFHCGAELTAGDAVATLLRVLKNPASAAQLQQHVARDKAQRHGFAVHPVSRYRFEIGLTRRLPDLLARLALPECSLRHDGRACFSGPWRVAEQDPAGLLLTVHAKHADAALCQYKGLRWERFGQAADFAASPSAGPYVYLYPGTYCKSPPEDLLKDELCRTLGGGMSLLFKLRAPEGIGGELRARLAQATRTCFGRNSLWRRAPLGSLVPKHHVLHTPFPADGAPAHARRLALRLSYASGLVPAHMWEQLRRVAAEELALDLELAAAEQLAAPAEPGAQAELKAVYYAHPADAFTPLAQFAAERRGRPEQGGKDAIDFCHSLVRQHGYAPFLTVPFVARANRAIRPHDPEDPAGLLRFADVRPSSDQLRVLRMKEGALKALGAGLQMFVHDVKRPFAMVQGLLGLLEAADDPARLRDIAGKYLPEVRGAVDAVGRLIQDILEIGSDTEPGRDDVALRPLVEGVLHEAFALRPPPGLSFEYRFGHRHLLLGDPQKLARVVANIVGNASEAMQQRGLIWFETSEVEGDGMLTLTIGNTNSFIPEELRAGLFDRFFTEGKKHGTGLGLAIVKKIVNDHGGEVWCESDQGTGTRFLMTLPLSATSETAAVEPLPRRAAELRPRRAAAGEPPPEALARLAAAGGATLLLVDDDPFYLAMLQELLSEDERRLGRIAFRTAQSEGGALAALAAQRIDVAIVDVDLGRHEASGLDVVRRLRAQAPGLRICVHSSGAPFELQKQTAAAGGDLFLAKPMAREHLLRLLLPASAPAQARPRIAVIDDDALMLEMWEACPAYAWLPFAAPAALLAALAADPALLSSLRCVVTDQAFAGAAGPGPATGLALAAELARRAPALPVLLATGWPLSAAELPPNVRGVIAKDAAAGVAHIEKALSDAAAAASAAPD